MEELGAFLQLPEERQHSDHRRIGPEDRSRNVADQEFGRKSLNEIKEILGSMGLALGMKPDAHGRLVAPPPPPPGSMPADGGLDEEGNNFE